MNNFEVKKKIVLAGGSRIFNNWAVQIRCMITAR